MKTVLVTGGRGFIGSNFIKYLALTEPSTNIVNVDAFTYAARPGKDFATVVERADIRDQSLVAKILARYKPDTIYHFAAESHVCRSISGPKDFVTTNVMGTFNMLEEARLLWGPFAQNKFMHVSTDEVFGQLNFNEDPFNENCQIKPRSPYAASKAASDHLALAYHETYQMNVTVTNCSNNFGPNQHEEKLIPKAIRAIFHDEPITIYGSGNQIRDWLFVTDHCRALHRLANATTDVTYGQRFCIGGDVEMSNIGIIRFIHARMLKLCPELKAQQLKLKYTDDRPTDDMRYAINNSKISAAVGWKPSVESFERHIDTTIKWYLENGWK